MKMQQLNELIPLSKETIDNIFRNETEKDKPHQSNILIALYKLVYSNWDRISKLNGYPSVNPETQEYLFTKFIQFDKKHHPNVLNGGLFMNNGFSSNKEIPIWHIKPCEAEY